MYVLSPVFNLPGFYDSNGLPLAGAKIYVYEGGSFSNLASSWTSAGVLNANPVILDSAGQLPDGVSFWLLPGVTYNFSLKAVDNTVLQVFENIVGIQGAVDTGPEIATIWQDLGAATYLNGTSFQIQGDQTQVLKQGTRVKVTQSPVTYGLVTGITYEAPSSSVTILNDGPALNSSLSAVSVSLIRPDSEPVDAGSVFYSDTQSYAGINTSSVGAKIQSLQADLEADIAANEVKRARDTLVYSVTEAGGSFTGTAPGIAHGTDQKFTVRFGNTGNVTAVNLNLGAGALPLKKFDLAGALVSPVIYPGLVSDVVYSSSDSCYVLLDAIPDPAAVTPRGGLVYGTNGTWVCPPGVYFAKVTCKGGGGGGGNGGEYGGDPVSLVSGGSGGQGALSITFLEVTPGTSYAIQIGLGGAGGASGGNGTAGGTTSFGITLAVAGGGGGGAKANYLSPGASGANSGTGTGLVLAANSTFYPYGAGGNPGVGGGTGGTTYPTNGTNGLCMIEY